MEAPAQKGSFSRLPSKVPSYIKNSSCSTVTTATIKPLSGVQSIGRARSQGRSSYAVTGICLREGGPFKIFLARS